MRRFESYLPSQIQELVRTRFAASGNAARAADVVTLSSEVLRSLHHGLR